MNFKTKLIFAATSLIGIICLSAAQFSLRPELIETDELTPMQLRNSTKVDAPSVQTTSASTSESLELARHPEVGNDSAVNHVERASTLERFRQELSSLDDSAIESRLQEVIVEINDQQFVELANQGQLAPEARERFDLLMTIESAARLVLLERHIERVERDIL